MNRSMSPMSLGQSAAGLPDDYGAPVPAVRMSAGGHISANQAPVYNAPPAAPPMMEEVVAVQESEDLGALKDWQLFGGEGTEKGKARRTERERRKTDRQTAREDRSAARLVPPQGVDPQGYIFQQNPDNSVLIMHGPSGVGTYHAPGSQLAQQVAAQYGPHPASGGGVGQGVLDVLTGIAGAFQPSQQSLPPTAAPAKDNTALYVALGLGALALGGVVIAAAASSRRDK